MTLYQAIADAGMTPPKSIVEGRWVRFPGMGKSRGNRAGWCKLITPTMGIFGDWSSGLSETWRDDSHRDDERSAKLLKESRERERQFAAQERTRQATVAAEARKIVRDAVMSGHPYLEQKGFKQRAALVREGKLVIAVRDAINYSDIISVQLIDEFGEKRFLTGGRTRGGIHRLGVEPRHARRVALCEGYATGLSVDAALQRLPAAHAVIVCFSARNLELVAQKFPGAFVCADNDKSCTGEESAKRTGLKWLMPTDAGTDFNDMHLTHGLPAVTEALRAMF
jgi:putative DNA primase/helicase